MTFTRVLTLSLTLLPACREPSKSAPPAATATTAAAPRPLLAPDAVCKRISEISPAKYDSAAHDRCVFRMDLMKNGESPLYECHARCVDGSNTRDAHEVCVREKCKMEDSKLGVNFLDAEGTRMLGSIETGSKDQFQMETDQSGEGSGPFVHTFCPSSKQPVPKELPEATHAVTIDDKVWSDPTWKCLHFSIHEPQLFQYSYESNGKLGADARWSATARRRLPNGKVRTYHLTGKGLENGDATRETLTEKDE